MDNFAGHTYPLVQRLRSYKFTSVKKFSSPLFMFFPGHVRFKKYE
jgi:hypothetical protein